MKNFVAKIGGSCLSNKNDLRRIIEIVKKSRESGVKPILVVSAFKSVTNELLAQAQNALTASFDLEEIQKLHYKFIRDLSPHIKEKTKNRIKALLKELRESLLRVSSSHVLSPSDKDEIVSYGEKLATEIVAAYLNDSGFKAKPLWDRYAGIITNSNFGNGSILDESKDLIREKLHTTYIPVVAGFFGRDRYGRTVTLGRGGSDYVATFIASALRCEVILFKDVDGLMTADPKIIKTASTIEKINYLDALELAHYGSKVIYEKSIIPAMEAKIPIKIANFNDPSKQTIIYNEGEETSVSCLTNVTKVNIISSFSTTNVIASLLLELGALDMHPLLLTKASRYGISLVMEEDAADITQTIIRKIDKNANIKLEKNLGLVTVIGSKVREEGIARVCRFLSEKGINVKAIERSASGKNLCILVDKKDFQPAAKALHDLFRNLPLFRGL